MFLEKNTGWVRPSKAQLHGLANMRALEGITGPTDIYRLVAVTLQKRFLFLNTSILPLYFLSSGPARPAPAHTFIVNACQRSWHILNIESGWAFEQMGITSKNINRTYVPETNDHRILHNCWQTTWCDDSHDFLGLSAHTNSLQGSRPWWEGDSPMTLMTYEDCSPP